MFVKKRWSREPAERGGVQVAGGPLPAPAPRTADESAGDNARRHFLAGSGDYHGDDRGGGTHGQRVVVREPSPGGGNRGLLFGLWLTGEEHVGVFLDSRPTRDAVQA